MPAWLRVVFWWELRRLPFNLVVACVGGLSLFVGLQFFALGGGEPLGLALSDALAYLPLVVIVYFIGVNSGYTIWWTLQLDRPSDAATHVADVRVFRRFLLGACAPPVILSASLLLVSLLRTLVS